MSYYPPEGNTPTESGWFDIPQGQSTLVDAARARTYSAQFKEKAQGFFSLLVADSADEEKSYLRGLQIIYLLGLEDLVTPYWNDSSSLFEQLDTRIDGIVSMEELKGASQAQESFSKLCERLLLESSVSNSTVSLVREEVEALGPLSTLAKSCVYYYIILGELSNAGGVVV
jgi:hypothetical protein